MTFNRTTSAEGSLSPAHKPAPAKRARQGIIFLLVILILATAPLAAQAQAGSQPLTQPTDVKGHWAEATIISLVNQGILDGFPDGTFRPDAPVTADQFIKMLLLSYSSVYPNGERKWRPGFTESLSPANRTVLQQDYGDFSFKPSLTGYWAKPFIDLAGSLHFITKSQFPDFKANLKREQVAEIIYFTIKETGYTEDETLSRANASKLSDYLSAKDREQRFVAEVYGKGIMEGYSDGYFGMGREVTRAEALTILERLTDPSKRVATPVNRSAPDLERIVPTADGHYKKIVFPTAAMAEAYTVMTEAASLRGTNYDLTETAAKLYKDATAKSADLGRSGFTSGSGGEEASLWMDPSYRSYGLTVRLQDGVLARNQEALFRFSDYVLGHDAARFRDLFTEVCTQTSQGTAVEPQTRRIGTYAVEVKADAADGTVMFTILEQP
jgi:hypothetical protein